MAYIWWIIGLLYLVWDFFFLIFVIQKSYNEDFKVAKNFSKEIKKKYFMYYR